MPRLSQLTHNVCRTFSERSHKVGAVLTIWENSGNVFHKVSVILHVLICFTQNMKQPEIYKIEDGLHELGVMGKKG